MKSFFSKSVLIFYPKLMEIGLKADFNFFQVPPSGALGYGAETP